VTKPTPLAQLRGAEVYLKLLSNQYCGHPAKISQHLDADCRNDPHTRVVAEARWIHNQRQGFTS
jgi:hypothetical protein